MTELKLPKVDVASETELWPIARVKPYKRNAKNHPPEQIALLARLIERHGFDQNIVVDAKGVIIKGHGRWLAAKKLGMVTVPVVVRELPPAQAAEARLADNRVAEFGWDFEALTKDFTFAREMEGFDESVTGFRFENFEGATEELKEGGVATRENFPPVVELEDDVVPKPPKKAVTKLGDIWELGAHRLICGDSTDEGTVKRLLGSTVPFLMVTDPPYGVNYDPEERAASRGLKAHSTGKVLNDDRADWREAYKLFPGAVAYVWCASLFSPVVHAGLAECGFEARAQIIWAKQQFVFGRGHYHWQHEPCWYAVRKGAVANWAGDRKQTTVWQLANKLAAEEDMNTTHGTQKPLECMGRPIRNHGDAEAVVYDPFSGSGTTIIAAQKLDRVCYGVELSPEYCDVIVERWENLTGKKAQRVRS